MERVTIRRFDPERDSIDDLATMNEWSPEWQRWWAGELRRRLILPQNYLVAVTPDGRMVGAVLLLDAGIPMLVIEGAYLRPEWRTYALGRQLLQAIDAEARARGVRLILSHVPPRIDTAMQYYGYQRMTDNRYTLQGRVVPTEAA